MEPTETSLRFPVMIGRLIATAAVLAVAATALPTAAQMGPGSRIPPYLPVPHGAAVIMNTGSTNANGYRIVIQQHGAAEYVVGYRRATATVTGDLTKKFFDDLAAAAPLDQLPSHPCMKSVSFGTSLFVWWSAHGRSPDLSCPTDSRGSAVRNDAQRIASELDLTNTSGPVLRPLMPGEQRKPMPPTPSPTST